MWDLIILGRRNLTYFQRCWKPALFVIHTVIKCTCKLCNGFVPKVHIVSAEKDGGQLNLGQRIEKG